MCLIDMIEDLTFHQRSVERSKQCALTVSCGSGFGKEGTRFAQLSTILLLREVRDDRRQDLMSLPRAVVVFSRATIAQKTHRRSQFEHQRALLSRDRERPFKFLLNFLVARAECRKKLRALTAIFRLEQAA